MSKKEQATQLEAAKVSLVTVQLLCIYSGDGTSASPGDLIEVDAEEAERLIALKAAVAVDVAAPKGEA